MKKKTLFMKSFLAMCAISLAFCGQTVSSFAQDSEIRVTIKGNITKIENVGQYISSDTRLQLYPCEITDKVNVQMNKKGQVESVPGETKPAFYLDKFHRLVPPSGLPRIGLPHFGRFNFFRVKGLEPGKCYKVCVMMLDKPYPGMVSLVDKDGKPFEVTIPEPEANKDEILIDFTKDDLMIPEPGMLKK